MIDVEFGVLSAPWLNIDLDDPGATGASWRVLLVCRNALPAGALMLARPLEVCQR